LPVNENVGGADSLAAQAHAVLHWRGLRARLESQIQRLEVDLRDFRAEHVSIGTEAAERRYERLLRLRRVRAKVASRERLEATQPAA
jgi:hypothetical protein